MDLRPRSGTTEPAKRAHRQKLPDNTGTPTGTTRTYLSEAILLDLHIEGPDRHPDHRSRPRLDAIGPGQRLDHPLALDLLDLLGEPPHRGVEGSGRGPGRGRHRRGGREL